MTPRQLALRRELAKISPGLLKRLGLKTLPVPVGRAVIKPAETGKTST